MSALRQTESVGLGLLAVVVVLTTAPPVVGETLPLPPWSIYGGAINGTWDGSSSSPDTVELTVTLYGPPTHPAQFAVAAATNSTSLLQIAPATKYGLTFTAMASGSSGDVQALMLDGTEVITNIGTWAGCTNAFTTAGPDDPRVGGDLNVLLFIQKVGEQYGTATVTFTNLQLEVSTARPTLRILQPAVGEVRLQWSTNFYWCVSECTTNLQTGVWNALTNQPYVHGDQLMVEVDTQSGPHFFRLRQPW